MENFLFHTTPRMGVPNNVPIINSNHNHDPLPLKLMIGEDLILMGYKYRVMGTLGKGSFGVVYHLKAHDGGAEVALKTQSVMTPKCSSILQSEGVMLQQYLSGLEGVPRVISFCCQSQHPMIMAMTKVPSESCYLVTELLGPNLETLLRSTANRSFSQSTLHLLAINLLMVLEAVHSRNVVHRDVKPENICISRYSNKKQLYLIDFGLAALYRHQDNLQHIFHKKGLGLTGTGRFASLACHRGEQGSRRDDLESLAYTLIYCAKGLPWDKVEGDSKEQRMAKIKHLKMFTPTHEVCKFLPPVFEKFLEYSRQLGFEAAPDYAYLLQLFSRSYEMFRKGGRWDEFEFDYRLGGVEGYGRQ